MSNEAGWDSFLHMVLCAAAAGGALEMEIKEGGTVSFPHADEHAGILEVDYGRTLRQMIAAGGYGIWNRDATANRFPIVGNGTEWLEFRVFCFYCGIFSEIAVKEIADEGAANPLANPWEPAGIEHLLAYGAEFPERQMEHPIIGLGSVGSVRGFLCVPGLSVGDRGRFFGLGQWGTVWPAFCRFLAVRRICRALVA